MRDFVIITDSCCDLTQPMADEMGLLVQPLSLLMGENTYKNYLDGREIGFKEFYDRLRGGELGTTSAVSVGDFTDVMRPVLEAGKDVLCIAFSGALSTTYQSAVIAADDLKEEFPDADIRVVDSKNASMGQGLLVHLCNEQKKAGKGLEEVHAFCLETLPKTCAWFTVNDLYHLKRGGRVSAATAVVGSMLSIKPVLHVDSEGRLTSVSKARGRKPSLMALVDQMEKTAIDPANQTVFISHGDCLEDAQIVADEIRRRFGTQDIRINYVGPVIGNHAGAGVVALFFLGTEK